MNAVGLNSVDLTLLSDMAPVRISRQLIVRCNTLSWHRPGSASTRAAEKVGALCDTLERRNICGVNFATASAHLAALPVAVALGPQWGSVQKLTVAAMVPPRQPRQACCCCSTAARLQDRTWHAEQRGTVAALLHICMLKAQTGNGALLLLRQLLMWAVNVTAAYQA